MKCRYKFCHYFILVQFVDLILAFQITQYCINSIAFILDKAGNKARGKNGKIPDSLKQECEVRIYRSGKKICIRLP